MKYDEEITDNPLVRDLIHFAIRKAVRMTSWESYGMNLHEVDTTILCDEDNYVSVRVFLSFNTDHTNGGTWADWIVYVPTDKPLTEISVRTSDSYSSRCKEEVIYWTGLGEHILMAESQRDRHCC